MDERLSRLLRLVVEDVVARAEPVGSQHLVEAHGLDMSPATVRNAFAELEAEGYLYQPHTSSGRLPSEKGYRLYIDELMKPAAPTKRERDQLAELRSKAESPEAALKASAKLMAEWTGSAFILGLRKADAYYTGLSPLFNQPEFRDWSRVVGLGEVLDRLDDVLARVRTRPFAEPTVLVGQECPFGNLCGAVFMDAPGGRGLLCALGPMRMPYARHVGLLLAMKDLA